MEGTRLLLARHAETSAPDRFHGAESDIGLSDWGSPAGRAARAVAQASEVPPPSTRRPCAGPSTRPRRSAALATSSPCRSPALHERKIGPLSGKSREEGWATYAASKERWIAGDLEYTHPGGESYADIRRRVVPIIEDLAARHRGETIVVVAHGVVIRVILTSLVTGFQPADFDRIAIDFASVNDLLFDGTDLDGRSAQPVRVFSRLSGGAVRRTTARAIHAGPRAA